jgi:hypothetical protein
LLPLPRHAVKIRCHQRNPTPHLGHHDAADHLEYAASNRNFVAVSLRPYWLKPDHQSRVKVPAVKSP